VIYLSGCTNNLIEESLVKAGIGLILNPKSGYVGRCQRFRCFAIDNGCYANKWEEGYWLDWLATIPTDKCLFAVAPDVYPDAKASLERGLKYTDLIRSMGFPVAIVAQDGAEKIDYPWDEFDCMFIGGERTPKAKDEWKISKEAELVCNRARNAGKWVHMGRVNSLMRLKRAERMGCNSVDGTYLKYGPSVLLPNLLKYVEVINDKQTLFEDQWETHGHSIHRNFS